MAQSYLPATAAPLVNFELAVVVETFRALLVATDEGEMTVADATRLMAEMVRTYADGADERADG